MANKNDEPYVYSFEFETLIAQFVSMIRGAVLMRYDYDNNTNERVIRHTVSPWIAFGMKHRVIHSLVNQAKNYSYPYITCKITSIEGNSDRLTSKHIPIRRYNGEKLLSYDKPTPITMGIEVTLTSDLISDTYQMYGKLATQFQPYCTFSWYVPNDNLDKADCDELTGKIEWDFNGSFDIKDSLQESDKEEYVCTMNFKITGWIFPNKKKCTKGIIYDIGTSTVFSAEDFNNVLGLENFTNPLLSAARKEGLTSYDNPREWNNGHPRIVNVYQMHQIEGKKIHFLLDTERVRPFSLNSNTHIVLDGYNFERAEVLFVPRDFNGIITDKEKRFYDYGSGKLFPLRGKISSKHGVISGYPMNITNQSRNAIVANFEGIEYHGNFDIIVADNVDYDSCADRLSTDFIAK